jgi:IS5 family transposase
MLEVELPIPDHTTLSRRLNKLGAIQLSRLRTDRPIHLLIDSTGLRVHVGHMQKPPRNRAWRKLHLAVDADTGEIVASDLTTRRTHDCTQVPALPEQIADPIASVSADGAYDTKAVYEAANEQGEGGGCGYSFHLGVMPSSAQIPRPHRRKETETFT